MKILRLILSLSLFSLIIKCQDLSPLDWTDPVSGTKYDFTSLKRNPE